MKPIYFLNFYKNMNFNKPCTIQGFRLTSKLCRNPPKIHRRQGLGQALMHFDKLGQGSRCSLPLTRDLVDHAAEDEAVEGEDGVPVEAAVNAQGAEGGGLGETVLVVDFEFEPGFAG